MGTAMSRHESVHCKFACRTVGKSNIIIPISISFGGLPPNIPLTVRRPEPCAPGERGINVYSAEHGLPKTFEFSLSPDAARQLLPNEKIVLDEMQNFQGEADRFPIE